MLQHRRPRAWLRRNPNLGTPHGASPLRSRPFQVRSAQQPDLASRRTYGYAIEGFISWYCSEPRLALNRIVVTRYRIHLESRRLAAATINQRVAAVRRLAYDTPMLLPDSFTMCQTAFTVIPSPRALPTLSTRRNSLPRSMAAAATQSFNSLLAHH